MSANSQVKTMSSEMILPLSSTQAILARAGGKGTNLAELTRAGFDVPPGFIITTDAYRAFVAANQIESRLLTLMETLSLDDPVALDTTSGQIRSLFTGGIFPAEIERQSRIAYSELSPADKPNPPVAVRSSATAEDLPGLSFAGQQDTYLNIVGPEALIDAIKACWGSLWTARAIGYRARNRIPPDNVALAVVVQIMIPSEVSGVLFTANALTGHRGEIVIDASYGLGEAIVSGQVEPDHYVVNKKSMQITTRKIGAKALAILPRAEGGTEQTSLVGSQEQALPDAQIFDLVGVAKRVADHFGSPQDIEWAWAGGQLYLLQSRPITSLYPVPESLLRSNNLRVLFSFNSAQGVVEPFTPLGRDMFPTLLTWMFRDAGISRKPQEAILGAGGRLYIDVTDLVSDKGSRPLVLAVLANIDPGARRGMISLIDDGRIQTRPGVNRKTVFKLILTLRSMFLRMPMTLLRPEAARARAIRNLERYIAQVRQTFNEATSLEARFALIDQAVPTTLLKNIFMIIVPAMAPGLLSQGIVDRWLSAWLGIERGKVPLLLRGIPGNPTTDMDLHLWRTAQAIRSDTEATAALRGESAEAITSLYQQGELPPVAHKAISEFLGRYGMRAVGEIDIGRPRWREDPRSIIQTLCSYLQIDDPTLAPDRLYQTAAVESEKLTEAYISQVKEKKGALYARLLGMATHRMRVLSGLREMPKFYMVILFDLMRTVMLEVGRELTAQGKLERPEDIFFLPLDVLRTYVKGQTSDLKAVVHQERADYERELGRRQIPRLLLSTGEALYEGVSSAGSNDLVGDGVSPGTVEGKVRVVHDPRGVRLEPGEILVCPATDPGWTPLFLSAGGLVTELGGWITHGSVVAREYGIPAVVGVHEATTRLKTGQRVRVDGSAGRVVVLD